MRTKKVITKTGQIVKLFFAEDTQKWCLSEDEAKDNFSKYILAEDCLSDNLNKIRRIRRYYESCKIEYTRNKIKEMINLNIKNIDVVYDMIMVALIEGIE